MANSLRFNQLEDRVKELGSNLLPKVDVAGNYDNRDLDLTRAYCLLCHAEIEAYLEDIILEVVRAVFNYWKADNSKIPEIIFNLACNYRVKTEKKELPSSLVHLSVKSFEDIIDKNHGIKEHNIDNILNPIGYPIDKTLITVLHNFGDTRGDIAHKSFKTQQQLDPQTEHKNVSVILTELKKFDIDFYKYMNPTILLSKKKSWWQQLFCK